MRRRQWPSPRRKPYTAVGIKRVGCVKCGAPAFSTWQVCADGRAYRPVCLKHDIELNEMVLRWMGHPLSDELMGAYRAEQEAQR